MREERIAARYGRGLFLCIEDEDVLLQVEKELSSLSTLLNAPFSELRTLLSNPAFSQDEQVLVINELASVFGLQSLTQNLLLLLVEKGRTQLLHPITKAFSNELDGKLGRVHARVSSAKPLSEQELAEVLAALRRRIGKDIVAQVAVDERAVMGLKAQIGGLIFDGTLSTMLDQFKRKLVEAPING